MDVLSIDVDSRLRFSRSSLECKSGKGQSGEPYTLVWLAGFRQLLSLDKVTLVRQTVSSRGRKLAHQLGVPVLDDIAIRTREPAHAWVPERFAHLDGPACLAAEKRTDTQLKGLPDIPQSVTKFLRGGALLSEPASLLSGVDAFGKAASRQGGLPEPAATVLAAHALVAIVLAGLQDAGRLNEFPTRELRQRLTRALTVGDPNDMYLLPLLEKADALVQYFQKQTHRSYVDAGADPIRIDVPSLRGIIAEPPTYLDDYIDFVERLRANPLVARDLLQTTELLCFDALLGDTAWRAPAFEHLFTTEHQGLVQVALRCLAKVGGEHVALHLRGLSELLPESSAQRIVERRISAEGAHKPTHLPQQPELMTFDSGEEEPEL
ncbi:hypothetical protein IG195_21475 (plasmid) [Arthrobacter sp. TES]|uniref:hypothetical protein n=1 Tax=Paenarthrobacter TaxID=1742992 RepID=UPI000397D1C6|nr:MULTISPECIES: hypothetical protein [Paenarthrobacter]ERI35213.1 hypothetical protein M707_22950 [Arthrobacter sp. AK-YN10]QOI65914.1 hypothetical protein IG195_21475 [Arthrobacter sp. TES]UOD83540.1 hypothetical protein MQZ73_21145 [Paenarthrobacter ureafaciens]WOC63328.1 hypothetical protein RI444_21830 [Paenarthrobacter sp. AT5]